MIFYEYIYIKAFKLLLIGIDHEIDLSLELLGMSASLVGSIALDTNKFYVTLEAKLCANLLMTCLQPIEILTNIKFPTRRPPGELEKSTAMKRQDLIIYKHG